MSASKAEGKGAVSGPRQGKGPSDTISGGRGKRRKSIPEEGERGKPVAIDGFTCVR